MQELHQDYEAKEKAYEDTLQIIKKAYENDMISLTDFLNNVRFISRKQFMKMVRKTKINRI